MNARSRNLALAAILVASAAVRLYHLTAPMADSLQAKQAFVANRARSIARAPINPLRDTLDFLDDRGDRTALTEEFPLYHGLLGLGFRLFGEHDWVGHALSLAGSLVAILAFFDLARREWDDRSALIATVLLSASPLFIFYGRAVLPEPWMLASMLTSAACYRRYLDGGRRRWLAGATLAGLSAGLFKYFGLIVLMPLAAMAWRKAGSWRAVVSRSFLTMSAAMTLPVFAWVALVFLRSANPLSSGWADGEVYPYFIFQAPEILLSKPFWAGLLGRFPMRDCGPVTTVLIVAGMIAVGMRRASIDGFMGTWTITSLFYYVLLGPKFRDHDYYELMMLPAASLWATTGLSALSRIARQGGLQNPRFRGRDGSVSRRDAEGSAEDAEKKGEKRIHAVFSASSASPPRLCVKRPPSVFAIPLIARPRPWLRVVPVLLAVTVAVQSPWVSRGFFRQDEGKLVLAGRLRALCPPEGRVVAIGPGIEFPTVVHYSRREGWPVHSPTLPESWRSDLDRYRAAGASLVAVYFEPKATAAQRASYAPLLRELPVIERRRGARARSGGSSEFVILSLGDSVHRR